MSCNHDSQIVASIGKMLSCGMRTTVTLDFDVHGAIQKMMRERNLSLKEAVNTAIRLGLGIGEQDGSFTFPTHRMGPARVDLDKALAVATDQDE